jgi:hypothetical protein
MSVSSFQLRRILNLAAGKCQLLFFDSGIRVDQSSQTEPIQANLADEFPVELVASMPVKKRLAVASADGCGKPGTERTE